MNEAVGYSSGQRIPGSALDFGCVNFGSWHIFQEFNNYIHNLFIYMSMSAMKEKPDLPIFIEYETKLLPGIHYPPLYIS